MTAPKFEVGDVIVAPSNGRLSVIYAFHKTHGYLLGSYEGRFNLHYYTQESVEKIGKLYEI